jgi:gliding motility-associated-like protein
VAISTDKPDPIQDVASVISGSSVELDWVQPAGFTSDVYTVTRQTKSAVEFTTPETTYTDTGYDPEAPWCYTISYNDKCGNSSDNGSSVCPLLLHATLNGDNHVALTWDAYAGYTTGVQEYIIEKYTTEGVPLATYTTTETSYLDDSEDLLIQAYVYTVVAIPTSSAVPESVSNSVEIIKNPNLFYPTAFTPNSDTHNDLFNVFGQYITDFEMSIFNRWGELMFTTTDISAGWDGTFKGAAMPEGTYTFVAHITDLAGRNFKRSGSVLLLRKK